MDATHTELEVLAIGCGHWDCVSLGGPTQKDPFGQRTWSCENFPVEETKAVLLVPRNEMLVPKLEKTSGLNFDKFSF